MFQFDRPVFPYLVILPQRSIEDYRSPPQTRSERKIAPIDPSVSHPAKGCQDPVPIGFNFHCTMSRLAARSCERAGEWMDLELTQEQKLLQRTVREFAEAEVKPLAKEID